MAPSETQVDRVPLARSVRKTPRRMALVAAAALFAIVMPVNDVRAQDTALAFQELVQSSDFRVRVSAALALGRSKAPGAREALERSLTDVHPAVRIASAAALGALGDPRAMPALERRLPVEPSPGAAAQLHASIDKIRRASSQQEESASAVTLSPAVRYLIKVGVVRNMAAVRGEELRRVLHDSVASRAQSLRDAAVVDSDSPLLRLASERHLSVVTLDASLTQLVESRAGSVLQVQARVEFTVRRDQNLRGALSGSATTFGSGLTISDEARRTLEDDAVDGAVQSALRGADQGLMVAAR
jgi:hypothetical protein